MLGGQEEMPRLETSTETPELQGRTENSFSALSFKEAHSKRKLFENQLKETPESEKPQIQAFIDGLKEREQVLENEVRAQGGLDELNQELELLEEMRKKGELSLSDIRDSLAQFRNIDSRLGIDSSDPHFGLRPWYFERESDKLIEQLKGPSMEPKKKILQAPEDPLLRQLSNLGVKIESLITVLEKLGQLQPSLTPEQIAQMTTNQVMAFYTQQTEAMRNVFGRLPPEVEKFRWVDAEVGQAFYANFQPNQEPHFYTIIESTEERKVWDARWRLARAAFVKKVVGAMPDKLCENQDLIDFTKAEMETLYNQPGIKFALEWYARAIARPEDNHKVDGKTILECEDEKDFDKFRKKLRREISLLPGFEIQYREDEDTLSLEDRIKLRSVDAIAWNWIFCSNLIESVDSRYSKREGRGRGRRSDSMASLISSDDLRAVFHPQEKFENKCLSNQEWGRFGKWGKEQMGRIKDEVDRRKQKEEASLPENQIADSRKQPRPTRVKYEYQFEGALLPNDYWTYVEVEQSGKEEHEIEIEGRKVKEIRNGIKVLIPECYPITSMKSFWETYQDVPDNVRDYIDKRLSRKTLLDRLLDGERIDWKHVPSDDSWRTNYLTVRMRKAVGFFKIFKEASKEGWSDDLIDIYTRLNLEGVLKDYYLYVLGKDEKVADRLAATHFHNLKVWAVYATQGGVGRPKDRTVTDPYSRSRFVLAHDYGRVDHERHLRQPPVGYLDPKEDLVIKPVE